MLIVDLHDQYRAMPGTDIKIMTVEAKPIYHDRHQIAAMEARVTKAARELCQEHQKWNLIPGSEAYVNFYTSMGINANRVSNPFKQAFRFTRKNYRSVSPIVDAAMFAEYGTGVSFQVLNAEIVGSGICVRPTTEEDGLCDKNGIFRTARSGEIGLFSDGQLLHCPTLGLSNSALWSPNSNRAVVRVMAPAGLSPEAITNAERRFFSKPANVFINLINEGEFSDE